MDASTPRRGLGPAALALIAATGLLSAGCSNKPSKVTAEEGYPLVLPVGTVSVYQLAGRLGLRVQNCSSTLATLGNDRNCVRIYAGECSQPSVSGRGVGPQRAVIAVGGMLFVSSEWESSVRGALIEPPPPIAEVPRPPAETGNGACVVIDPGHGGHDSGALGGGGRQEKAINLAIAKSLAQSLSASGVAARLTRGDDRFIELNDRADIANRLEAKLFVSIHVNSHPPNPSVNGFDVYIARSSSAASQRAAQAIAARMESAGVSRHGAQPKRDNFRVLVRTSCPAVLVETGFISNAAEAARLDTSSYQQQIAAAIARGILDFLNGR